MIKVLHITGVNPEPWVAPEAGIGRKGGKVYVQFYKSAGLSGYQEAVGEEIKLQNGELSKVLDLPTDEPTQVTFWLYRELSEAETTRKTNRNVADATNMQKALEDALQGILYLNDRKNVDVRTIVVEQTPRTMPHICIEIRTGEHMTTPPCPPRPKYGKYTPTSPDDEEVLF